MAKKARVLVVDDEEAIRLSIGKILELHGFSVDLAPDAATAIRMIGAEPFDILLTDLRMAGPRDGLAVVETMRTASPAAATLLMSAHPAISRSANTGGIYADEIVPKPIDIPALLRVMERRLAS